MVTARPRTAKIIPILTPRTRFENATFRILHANMELLMSVCIEIYLTKGLDRRLTFFKLSSLKETY